MVGKLERKITMLHTVHLYVSLQITRLDFAANYPCLYLVIRYACAIFSGICDPTFCMNHFKRVQTKVRVTEGPLRNFTLSIFSENMRKWFEHVSNIHNTYLRQKAGDLNLRCPPIFNVTVCDVCVRKSNGPTSP